MKKVDRQIIIQKVKENSFAIIFAFVTFIGLAVLPMINKNFGDSYETTGLVESITGMPSDVGDRLFLLVRLENDQLIRTYIHRSTMYKQGKTVKLKVIEPMFFGSNKYRFLSYVE